MNAFEKTKKEVEVEQAFQKAEDIKMKKNFGGYWIYPVRKVTPVEKAKDIGLSFLEYSLKKTVRLFIRAHYMKKSLTRFMGLN